MNVVVAPDWTTAYLALRTQIANHRLFPALVRATGNPNQYGHRKVRRLRALSTVICTDLELDRAVYQGNVLGAAVDAVNARSITLIQTG